MSPAQTPALIRDGWRLRCPFSLSAAPKACAEDSYGIEDGSSSSKSSKIQGQGAAPEETGTETGRQGRAGKGPAGQGSAEGRCVRKACCRWRKARTGRQSPDQQCRGDQGGRDQGCRQRCSTGPGGGSRQGRRDTLRFPAARSVGCR